MRPLLFTLVVRGAVDRVASRTIAARSAPGVVGRWRCVNRSREWCVSDEWPPVPQVCAVLCLAHRAFGSGRWALRAPDRLSRGSSSRHTSRPW
jgi:hypothetical protein